MDGQYSSELIMDIKAYYIIDTRGNMMSVYAPSPGDAELIESCIAMYAAHVDPEDKDSAIDTVLNPVWESTDPDTGAVTSGGDGQAYVRLTKDIDMAELRRESLQVDEVNEVA
jgi:hypothetical protein